MKRRELVPGTFFRYVCNPQGNIYWVPERDGDGKRSGPTPTGVMASGPNPISDDWDLEVMIVDAPSAEGA